MVRAGNRSAHALRAARWALTGKRRALAALSACALLMVARSRFRARLVAFRRRAAAGARSARTARARLPRSASRSSAPGCRPRGPAAPGSGMGRRNEEPHLSRARAAPRPGRPARQRIAQHAAHARERDTPRRAGKSRRPAAARSRRATNISCSRKRCAARATASTSPLRWRKRAAASPISKPSSSS